MRIFQACFPPLPLGMPTGGFGGLPPLPLGPSGLNVLPSVPYQGRPSPARSSSQTGEGRSGGTKQSRNRRCLRPFCGLPIHWAPGALFRKGSKQQGILGKRLEGLELALLQRAVEGGKEACPFPSALPRGSKRFTFLWPFAAVVGIFQSMALLVCFGEHSEISVYLSERGQPALGSGSLSSAQSENEPNLE